MILIFHAEDHFTLKSIRRMILSLVIFYLIITTQLNLILMEENFMNISKRLLNHDLKGYGTHAYSLNRPQTLIWHNINKVLMVA